MGDFGDNCPGGQTVGAALKSLALNPIDHLIRRWNWKSALLSSLLRGALFFSTNLVAGWHRALGALGERRAPGRVRLLGHVGDRERLADLYANCDALVHPNPREPLGLAPLEAMASGLPVVVPNSGGVLSYASAGNCWLAPPTGAAFASTVRELFADDRARRDRVERALATAEQFSWPFVTARYFGLYDRIFANSKRPWTRSRFEFGADPRALAPDEQGCPRRQQPAS
jgi:glycosyltransferase involved in cell wall biosynthesis